MYNSAFVSEVVQMAAQQVVGVKIKTTMETAVVDCSRLWQDEFGPRMAEISTGEASFGASIMIDAQSFEYWAALPYTKGSVPEGMNVLDIPEGFYAKVSLKSLDELMGAYQHMFQTWSENPEYTIRFDAPSYELYPPDHLETGHLSLYMPLRRQEK